MPSSQALIATYDTTKSRPPPPPPHTLPLSLTGRAVSLRRDLSEPGRGRLLRHVKNEEYAEGYKCVRFHPDGLILGTGTGDALVRIWDMKQAVRSRGLVGCHVVFCFAVLLWLSALLCFLLWCCWYSPFFYPVLEKIYIYYTNVKWFAPQKIFCSARQLQPLLYSRRIVPSTKYFTLYQGVIHTAGHFFSPQAVLYAVSCLVYYCCYTSYTWYIVIAGILNGF